MKKGDINLGCLILPIIILTTEYSDHREEEWSIDEDFTPKDIINSCLFGLSLVVIPTMLGYLL